MCRRTPTHRYTSQISIINQKEVLSFQRSHCSHLHLNSVVIHLGGADLPGYLGHSGDRDIAQPCRDNCLGRGDPQANGQVQYRAIIITLCKEEVLWDPMSLTRHPGELLGGNETLAGA